MLGILNGRKVLRVEKLTYISVRKKNNFNDLPEKTLE